MENNVLSVSLQEYQDKINQLKQSLNGLKETSEEYKKVIAEIAKLQDELNDRLKETSNYAENVAKSIGSISKNNNSLKAFKQETDNMKASLLKLDSTSEQYKKTVEEITAREAKLTEVTNVGKKSKDAAAGSYNAIQQQVRELVKENKNLEGGLEGNKEQFEQNAKAINELNEKLKEADASMGYFQRNVGDYKNSFMSAFAEMKKGPVEAIGGLNQMSDVISQATVKYGSLGGAIKAVASSIGTTLKGAFDLIVKHPIIALVAILVTTFMKIKDAIASDADATKAWQRAMSAFQPIMNLFQNALGFLAKGLATVADWMARNLPKALKTLGGALGGGLKSLASFLNGFAKIPTFMAKIWDSTVGMVIKAVAKVTEPLASILDAVGLDSWAEKLRKVQNMVYNFSLESGVQAFADGIVNGLNNAANAVDNFFNNIAQGQQEAYDRTVKQQTLNAEVAKQQQEALKSEQRQTELRDKIATASGKEKVKLLKELRQEIETNGQREVELARRTYELEKERQSLSPSSLEDKAYLRELENNVIKAENTYKNAFVSIDKMSSKTEASMRSEAEKTAEARTKAAKKAADEQSKLTKKEQEERTKYLDLLISLDKQQLSFAIKGSYEEYKIKKQLIEDEYQANLNRINQEIKDEAKKLNAIKLLNEKKNADLLTLDNDFWEQTETKAISNFKTILESIDKNSKTYSQARVDLAEKEVNFQVQKWDRLFKQFATSESEAIQNVWDNFAKESDIPIDIMKAKFQNFIGYINMIKEELWDSGGQAGIEDIWTFFGLELDFTEKDKEAINNLFKAMMDGIDAPTFTASFTQQIKKVGIVAQEENEKLLKRNQEQQKNYLAQNYQDNFKYYQDLVLFAEQNKKTIEEIKQKEGESEEAFIARKLEAQEAYYDALYQLAEHSMGGAEEFNSQRETAEHIHKDNMREIAQQMYKELSELANEDGNGRLAIQKKYNAEIEKEEKRHSDLLQKIDNDQAKRRKMTMKDWVSVSQRSANSIGSILDDVATMKEDQLNKDVENGKKSEEEAKREFETIKDFQIAAATIDMLSSLVSVNYSIWSDKSIPTAWAKIALSALESTAVLTSGMLNIQQIKNTEFGSSGANGGSGGGSSSSSNSGSFSTVDFSAVGVNPLLDENADMSNIQNVNVVSDETSGGDKRVYILQSDIEDSSRQVKVRENNTSF